jgi:hypothetical protein
MRITTRIANFFRRTKIALALVFAIVLAIVMTVISVTIYINSGVSTLDLSRPGYENVRQQIGESGPVTTFDSTGPLTPEVVDEFLKLYSADTERLEKTNDFSDANLDEIRERMLQPKPSGSSN